MKYIKKHFDAAEVVAYEQELADNQLDKDSLFDTSVHPSLKGADVYDIVRSLPKFAGLKERLFADQGGICCYCGCRLHYPTQPQYIVEHVYPKDLDRTMAGEYANLLLSCRLSDEEKDSLKKMQKKHRKSLFHCDKAKGANVLSVTPLQKNCEEKFLYDEFGEVRGIDDDASKDVETLNLNCKWLQTRRKAAIEGELFDEEGNLLDDDELRQRLGTIMRVDEDGMHSEFCFVVKKVLEVFLAI